jgi:paraquat-inducible protein A
VFPFLSFGKAGIVTHTKLVGGIIGLYHEGMYFIALMVGFTTVIAPALMLVGLIYLLVPLQRNYRLPGAEFVLKWLTTLKDWNMVEIFMIGIIVSAVKLHKMASLIPGVSAWSLMLLIFAFGWIYVSLDTRVLWESLERARRVEFT